MKRGRVLVVDDQVGLAENIAEILQGVGFQTEVVESAEDALMRVEQGGITAVLTDFRLPGASGAQLIEELRRRGHRMPALMMSAYTDEGTIDQSRAAGACLFLPKPVPLPTMIEAFESLARA
jgi:DNA-binding NtrC family response regulator